MHAGRRNACNWQTDGAGILKRIWQNEGLAGRMPGLKHRQELWQVALITLLDKITPDSIYFIAKAFIYTFTMTLGITHPRVFSSSYYLH